ncbi:penicillin-insensitive murein endopeptidase [Roseomonas sp. GC11]|uniref:penicillin-insensitive murein endopeptidase n=1 Tax=Roseomonas sp. GC11 TaxID=2950546 RepID=UPI0021086DD4|nr:penicillin-insensitive murein endopeptidase [Roseomonas sp. GC11]MCQ4160758.1 penicillin-insensitive murein endopeptidase [Roseomonas sp. GC11]
MRQRPATLARRGPWLAMAFFLAGATAAPGQAAEPAATAWAAARGPAAGPPRILGAHGLGCIAGAVALPPEGPGWEVVRLSRNRFWGHPALIATLRDIAGRARAEGMPPLWIGDLGQPRGGPMPWGHASHQIGLDADLWFALAPRPPRPAASREQIDVPSLVRPDGQEVDPARYTPAHARLVQLAAEAPGVDRVFVNPAIKKALCATHAGEPWMRRVRPWRGHDSHLHIRLRCPPGQAACQDQAPPPPGDGCDASLAWWFSDAARQPPAPQPQGPPPRLPAACAGILSER